MTNATKPMDRHSEIYAERRDWGRCIDVVIVAYDIENGMRWMAKPVELVEVGDVCVDEPTMRMTPAQAQRLMDVLWDCGIRPTEGTGSAGSLAATQAHLKDMQTIAMKLLDDSLQPAPVILREMERT